jgi:putative spermidine/putrescine transport system substrate-binding protein
MDQLYPLDVDRAFRSLDMIAPNVTVWWASGQQPAQLLADNEVSLASAFNGRIWAAAVHDGVPVDVEWNQGALDKDSWVIPKGTPHLKEAMELIRYTCQPQVQIELTKYINYGPTMPEAYQNLDAKARAVLPTSPENRPKQFVYNAKWWAENEAAVVERWNKWLLKR